jgi:hypothetical protein
MVTRFEAFLQADRRRSSTLMNPSLAACRMAFLTVERDTPATAAIMPMQSVHAPFLPTSAATTASTAASARVNRHCS